MKETYQISSSFQCDMYPKHATHPNAALRSSLEEAKEYMEEAIKKYRKSWTIMKEIDLD